MEIQFVDLETKAPLVTVKGPKAEFILAESEFLQNMREIGNQVNPNVLVVPLGQFPTDRRVLFTNILRGVPVGKSVGYNQVEYYPVGSEEEKDIRKAANARINQYRRRGYRLNQKDAVNAERAAVIFDTVSFLMLPEESIQRLLVFDKDSNAVDSVEDRIDHLLNTHAKYLYLKGLPKKMSREEFEEAKAYFDGIEEKYRSNMNRARMERLRNNSARNNNNNYNRSNNYNNSYNYLRDKEDEYRANMNVENYAPVEEEETENMSTIEYERFLREKYFKRARGALPLQNFQLNILNKANKNQARANERNNSAVVFYNPNKPAQTRKKNNRNKSNKKKTARNAWNV